MNNMFSFFSKEITEAIGWTLFHSVWQFALIAIILSVVLFFFGKLSAKTRYVISMISLLFVVLSSVLTFSNTYRKTLEKEELARQIRANPQLVVESFKKAIQETTEKNNESFFTPQFKVKWIVFKSYFQRNFPLILTIWMIGILFLILRFAGGLIYTNRLKYRHTAPLPSSFDDFVQKLLYRFNINKDIKFLQSFALKVPLTLGYLKPVVLMPASLLTGLPADQIENIIAHEIAHIKRHDYLFNILQSVIEILFFYHPAVWWISSVIRTEREHSCDDLAVEVTGDSLSFAKALTNVQEYMQQPENSYAMAFSGNKNKLFNRIERILTKPAMKKNLNERLIASCVIFTGLIILVVSTAFSTESKLNQSQNHSLYLSSGSSITVPQDSIYDEQDDYISEDVEVNDFENEENNREEMEQLYSHIEHLNIQNEDFYKNLEIMLENLDDELNGEILNGISGALSEMDVNAVVNEALRGAEAALNAMDINAIVKESMKGQDQDVDKISREAIKGAKAALENMDLNLIIEEALNSAEGALNNIDLENDESWDNNEDIGEDLEETLKDLEKGLDDKKKRTE